MNPKFQHLQMIQSVINRLAGNSFIIKGWSVTVMAAMIALLARGSEKCYILFTLFPTIMFWALDAIYLSQERRFKALYNTTRLLSEDKIDFSMEAKEFKKVKSWLVALASRTLLLFYGAIIVTVIIIYVWL